MAFNIITPKKKKKKLNDLLFLGIFLVYNMRYIYYSLYYKQIC